MPDLETKRDELNFANHRHAKSGPRQKSERAGAVLRRVAQEHRQGRLREKGVPR